MRLNILIIEDESVVALHIKKIVFSLGHSIIKIVKNNTDALTIAKEHNIDLVISDINIDGEVDGISCCRILQHLYNLDVLFITAYRDIATLEKAYKIDFIGYLVKPFREDELETMINLIMLKCKNIKNNNILTLCSRYTYKEETNELLNKGSLVGLTNKEATFLRLLITSKDSILLYDTIDNIIPYVVDGDDIFLKNIIPSRKLHKKYEG